MPDRILSRFIGNLDLERASACPAATTEPEEEAKRFDLLVLNLQLALLRAIRTTSRYTS
jgi:hypothetical protein